MEIKIVKNEEQNTQDIYFLKLTGNYVDDRVQTHKLVEEMRRNPSKDFFLEEESAFHLDDRVFNMLFKQKNFKVY